MKGCFGFLIICVSSYAVAGEGILGTKTQPISAPSAGSPVSGMAFVQMAVALAVVYLALRFVLPKALVRVNRRINPGLGSGIRIEESATFAGGTMHIVQARGKTLLVAVGNGQVACLADLTEPPTATPEPLTFQEMMDGAMGGHAVAEVPETRPEPSAEDVEAALRRLNRLAGGE